MPKLIREEATKGKRWDPLHIIYWYSTAEWESHEGIINLYDDNSEHIAVLMNIAKDILKIIPMKDLFPFIFDLNKKLFLYCFLLNLVFKKIKIN